MSLQADITTYQAEHTGILRITERFYRELTLGNAVSYGASAAGPYGKTDPHQRRIGVQKLRRSAAVLKKRLPALQKAHSFADLFIITEAVRKEIKGLGDLWSYDTALRIAFNRGLAFYPQAIFVHRNVLRGIKRLFTRRPIRGRTLPLDIFPKELQIMKPYELEDFLGIWGNEKNKDFAESINMPPRIQPDR